MKRLYLQIYLTIIAILLIATIAMAGLGRMAFDESHFDDMISVAGELASKALPPADATPASQQRGLDDLNARLRLDLALYSATGQRLAQAGRPLPPVEIRGAEARLRGGHKAWLIPLSDGRFLVSGLRGPGPWRTAPWLLGALGTIAVAVAIGAWPLTRRLTRRLERLKTGVDQLGEGDLAARVKIEGRDEIAALARSFNNSAERIEELVKSHKMLLANASHELRTPLTRINMALAMSATDPRERAQLKADIDELDQLIEEILLASRLDAIRAPERAEEIDLLALAAEEASRYGIDVEGESLAIRGDRTLLRRMIRNLVDNARRYAGEADPEVSVTQAGPGFARIEVRDRGPGIPDTERERIFAPFYRLAGSAETGRGSGLGLALVRQIARHHGGDVICTAAPAGGSLFSITLPTSESPTVRQG